MCDHCDHLRWYVTALNVAKRARCYHADAIVERATEYARTIKQYQHATEHQREELAKWDSDMRHGR